MSEIFILILALAGLWVGAELVIKGSLEIAERYRISQLFIGLTIVAFGTDLPELFIDISAAIEKLRGIDTSGLIIGETVGTSISQIALMFGILGLITVVRISKKELFRDGLVLLVSIALLFLLGFDGELSRTDGMIMIGYYGAYFYTLMKRENFREKFFTRNGGYKFWSVLSLIAGFAILIYSSNLTIEQAVTISEKYGIAQRYIGILFVGLGTSLPELVTTVSAIRRKAGRLAVGTLLGSTIFDILFTLGIGTVISGFFVPKDILIYDIPFLFIVCFFALIFLATGKKLRRGEAVILTGAYVIYFIVRLTGGLSGMG